MSTETIWNNQTIEEAKSYMRKEVDKGVRCVCCGQFARVYVRQITSSMACGLILLYRATSYEKQYIHIEDLFKSLTQIPSSVRGDVPKLRFWNLIEPQEGEREDSNPKNGYYCITEAGKQFVLGQITVNSKIRVYNDRFLGYGKDSTMITIQEALKNKFNYSELMK